MCFRFVLHFSLPALTCCITATLGGARGAPSENGPLCPVFCFFNVMFLFFSWSFVLSWISWVLLFLEHVHQMEVCQYVILQSVACQQVHPLTRLQPRLASLPNYVVMTGHPSGRWLLISHCLSWIRALCKHVFNPRDTNLCFILSSVDLSSDNYLLNILCTIKKKMYSLFRLK